MRVLIGCESSGAVRDEFLKLGHDAISCDLLPTTSPGPHIIGDVEQALKRGYFDLFIVHPPCTFLCASGLHWNHRTPGRREQTEQALAFVRRMLAAYDSGQVGALGLENPVGCISTRIEPPTQYIQPYQFGHDASKKTGLWLRNVPPLVSTSYYPPRIVQSGPHAGRKRWSNQSDAGQNNTPGGSKAKKSLTQWKIRSETYQGIAAAMAAQWGQL